MHVQFICHLTHFYGIMDCGTISTYFLPELTEVYRGSLLHYIMEMAKDDWLKLDSTNETLVSWMNRATYNETDHRFFNLPIYYPEFPDHEDQAGPHEEWCSITHFCSESDLMEIQKANCTRSIKAFTF